MDCYGNLSPLTKSGQHLVFNFFSFKENRLPFNVKVKTKTKKNDIIWENAMWLCCVISKRFCLFWEENRTTLVCVLILWFVEVVLCLFVFVLQIRDMGQEPCGRLSFLREPKSSKGLPQTAICNLNITLPTHKKVGPGLTPSPLTDLYTTSSLSSCPPRSSVLVSLVIIIHM